MTDPSPAETGTSCRHVDTCPLFPLFREGSNLEVWKTIYCHGDFPGCERFRLAETGKDVPLTLLPNGDHLPGA